MSRLFLLPLLCILPLLSACLDFVEVAGPTGGDRPARVFFSIESISERGQDQVEFHGLLEPSADSRSQPRAVTSDTFWVMGRSLLPQRIEPDATRYYRERWDHRLADVVVVRPPRVQGVSGELPLIRWYPPRRLDPDTIVLAEGRDLALRLRAREAASDPPAARISWSLLVGNERDHLRIERSGAVPATLVLPWSLLPAPREGTIKVTLRVWEDHAYEAPARDYLLHSSFRVGLDWTVRIVPAEGS